MQPTADEWEIAWKEVKEGSPRAAAVVASAFVEDSLRFALSQRFWEMSIGDFEKLYDSKGPLSGFYQMIELGHALGLFGPVFRRDLHTIRRIRNGFAHAIKPLTFDTNAVKIEVAKLEYVDSIKKQPAAPFTEERTPGYVDFIQHGILPTNTVREKYTASCEVISDFIFRWASADFSSRATKPNLP